MGYSLIIIGLILGFTNWFKPEKPKLVLNIIIILLLIVGAMIEALNIWRQNKNTANLKFSGTFSSKAEKRDVNPKFEFGNSGAILELSNLQLEPLAGFLEENNLTLSVDSGRLEVSTLVRDADGRIIAQIVKNDWKLNTNKIFDRNYQKDALEVINERGEVVLQIKLIRNKVSLQGLFYDSKGNGILVAERERNGEMYGFIEILGPGHLRPSYSIKPIFEYPSDQHLGKLIKE
jgi:hypothetical protein